MANNVPGYGYSGIKHKIYTAFTGLFTSSPLFATASYGNTVAPVPFLIYPYTLILKGVNVEIDKDNNSMVLDPNEIPTVINNVEPTRMLELDALNRRVSRNLPITIRFYLSGDYYQRWYYTGTVDNLEIPIRISNIKRIYGNGIGPYPSSLNYQSSIDILIHSPKRVT